MKTIVILSTEPWGKMLLSKMHYAIALAEQGDHVFFVNAPGKKSDPDIVDALHPNIQVIQLNEIKGRRFLMHKLYPVYVWLSNRYANRINKIVGHSIDELWCFNPHVYMNLTSFNATKTILFLYDFYQGKHIPKVANTADALISVSQMILDHYKDTKPPKLLLQHGLGSTFETIALKRLADNNVNIRQGTKLKFGYVGNLLRAGMDMKAAKEIIAKHQDIEFHFWGPWGFGSNNVSGKELPRLNQLFIGFLKTSSNVTLHGVKGQTALATEMNTMDGFLFLYDTKTDMNGASNSHKLMEYLSTGKVVVSTYVSNYAGTDLLTMEGPSKNNLPQLFEKVMKNFDEYNSTDLQKKRIQFALDNTYEKQIEKIRAFIN